MYIMSSARYLVITYLGGFASLTTKVPLWLYEVEFSFVILQNAPVDGG